MHRNSNITGNPISNFHNAGIFDFGHLQHVDFQCLFSYKNALTFTGKEKDSETGFYYFGARYYDPALSGLFLSIDPMADKYPSISPYAYCAWNPVKLVDPEGEEFIVALIKGFANATCEIIKQTVSIGAQNIRNGERFFSNWGNKIDLLDVAVEFGMGALDGIIPGSSKLVKSIKKATPFVGEAIKTMDFKIPIKKNRGEEPMFKDVLFTGRKDIIPTLIDYAGGVISGYMRKSAFGDDTWMELNGNKADNLLYHFGMSGLKGIVGSIPKLYTDLSREYYKYRHPKQAKVIPDVQYMMNHRTIIP